MLTNNAHALPGNQGSIGPTESSNLAYGAGRAARRAGKDRDVNPFSGMLLKHFWLAGWHDKDMEVDGHRFLRKRA